MKELLNENEKLKKHRIKAAKLISLRARKIDSYKLLKSSLDASKLESAAFEYVRIVHAVLRRAQADGITQSEVWLPEGKPHDARINDIFLGWCEEVGLDAKAEKKWTSLNWGSSVSRLWVFSKKQTGQQAEESSQTNFDQSFYKLAEHAEVALMLRDQRKRKVATLRVWMNSSMPEFIASEHMIALAHSLKGAQARAESEIEIYFSLTDDKEKKASEIFGRWCREIGLQTRQVTVQRWTGFGLVPCMSQLKIAVPACQIDADHIDYEIPITV